MGHNSRRRGSILMIDNTNITLDYYNKEAKNFSDGTQSINFSALQDEFCSYVPKHGHILDLGCGAGRDSKAFINAGYKVTAMDGSEELCKVARAYIGQDVICSTFQAYQPNEEFDGIWACASLLHLSYDDIISVMSKLANFLKTNGCFYASFKYGDFSGIRNGRFFQNMTEEEFKKILEKIPSYKVISSKITSDVRPGRENEKWLSIFLKKIELEQ